MSIIFNGSFKNFSFFGEAQNLNKNSKVNQAIHMFSMVSNAGWSTSVSIVAVALYVVLLWSFRLGNVLATSEKVEIITKKMETIVVT